jgi:hypothetical protein
LMNGSSSQPARHTSPNKTRKGITNFFIPQRRQIKPFGCL